ncbi:UDP-glucose 4-epimerase [Zhongshania aliphaticivorans]|uniref:UDP-glucose 4-epimerase n=1 Tax=Zhongshania aliphaticivorans TaxID=1470434 RepID=A0A5S9PP51_9GAMM|nr:UDP-glucose 4-epimerase GalE [Zhongshania aliphaticivorans]CAA0105715.1 UDP-glucose 4-epimerase [Zhongshania aliphaticivorans]CAA0105944.1 UDP-glucose 4-epimerase [Zhongshania aliphaticivorans]
MQTILVTGGAGYIGSHTVVELQAAGYDVVIVDNLVNSNPAVLNRIHQISGKAPLFVQADVRDADALAAVFAKYDIDAVIHFAGLKAVGESVEKPLQYYDNNVRGTMVLCQAMAEAGVFKLVFSSSATVYGPDAPVPYEESMPLGQPSSPYGASKAMVERVLADLCVSDSRWSVVALRYFNPIGAHVSGLIGEDPLGLPNNLMPFISRVAVGKLAELSVFGDDYNTPDGTCLRDYLHVVDLAVGHCRSLQSLDKVGLHAFNLGTGNGVSVLDMVKAFESVTGQKVPYKIAPRRHGDLPAFWANADKAKRELSWVAGSSLEKMMADTWRWQSNNPDGYGG